MSEKKQLYAIMELANRDLGRWRGRCSHARGGGEPPMNQWLRWLRSHKLPLTYLCEFGDYLPNLDVVFKGSRIPGIYRTEEIYIGKPMDPGMWSFMPN